MTTTSPASGPGRTEREYGDGEEHMDGEPRQRLIVGLNLVGLALLAWAVVTNRIGDRSEASAVAVSLLLLVTVVGWIAWVAGRYTRAPRYTLSALTAVSVAGGSLAAFAPAAMTFVGVAALGATMATRTWRWIAVVAAGLGAMVIATAATGHSWSIGLGGVAAALAGTVVGTGRREAHDRATRAAAVRVAEALAEAEGARAELLASRNHLARELHDVLAHTLSALSLQLEGLDALIRRGGANADTAVTDQLQRTKRLVREGLEEARGAVRALREDLPPLDQRLAALASERHAGIEVSGSPRDLAPDVSLALYRVAQEALTNVVKHSPGALADVRLGYLDGRVNLCVSNGRPAPAATATVDLAGTGGGYGLEGMRERIRLVGGHLHAGPASGGWRVEAEVPA